MKVNSKALFRTLSNIQDGDFCKNSERLFIFDYFCKKFHNIDVLTRFWVHLWSQKSSISGKAPSQMFDRVLNLPCEKLLLICLLNLINISHHISSKYSIVHGQIHVTLFSTYLHNNENHNSVSQPCISIDYAGAHS